MRSALLLAGLIAAVLPVRAAELEVVARMVVAPGNIAIAADGTPILSLHQFYSPKNRVVELLPDGATTHLPWIVFLTLINVVYGAFIAFRQRDFKYVIGFSSVSHMGLVSMGFAHGSDGMTGAGLQMFSAAQ
jgi:hypothetical protein